jgi:hypothetical protein
MFKLTSVDLKTVKANSYITMDFPYTEDMTIQTLTTSCGCGVASDLRTEKMVRVTYTPTPVPPNLIANGKSEYDTAKHVTVEYTSSLMPGETRTEILYFKAKVKNYL